MVLARILKIPLQNRIHNISACSDIAKYLYISFFKFLHQLHLVAFCVKMSYLYFSHVIEDGLLGKDMVT